MKRLGIYIATLFLFCFDTYSQNINSYTTKEKEYLQVFSGFKSYISQGIRDRVDLGDSVHLKRMLLQYVYGHAHLDSSNKSMFSSNELPINKMQSLKEQINSFYTYFAERQENQLINHLSVCPSRLSSDKCIYYKMSAFQKENSFIYFDDRNPGKVLGYLLFIPKMDSVSVAPRIWSWVLMFKSGTLAFKAATGEEGLELLF